MTPVIELHQRLPNRDLASGVAWMAALEIDAEGGGLAEPQTRAWTERLASEMVGHLELLATEITRTLLASEPRLLDPDDATCGPAIRRATEAHVGTILSTLAYGVEVTGMQPPGRRSTSSTDSPIARTGSRSRCVPPGSSSTPSAGVGRLRCGAGDREAALPPDPRDLDGAPVELRGPGVGVPRRRLAGGAPAAALWARRLGRRPLAARFPRARHRRGVRGAGRGRLSARRDAPGVAFPPSVERRVVEDLARHLRLACAAPTVIAAEGEGAVLWVGFSRAPGSTELAALARHLEGQGPSESGSPRQDRRVSRDPARGR